MLALGASLLLSPSPCQANDNASRNQLLSETLAELVEEVLPREYEKAKNWGHTKRITTGVRNDGIKLYRRKQEVSHGTWKKYRLKLVDPEENLQVRVENVHTLDGGGTGLTLTVDAKVTGWSQQRSYNRGVHLLTLTAEADADVTIAIDCEVRGKMVKEGFAIDPKVTDARLDLREFKLTRFGEATGKVAEELGKGIEHFALEELDGENLTAKLNRAIDKKRDRLVLSPSKLLAKVKDN